MLDSGPLNVYFWYFLLLLGGSKMGFCSLAENSSFFSISGTCQAAYQSHQFRHLERNDSAQSQLRSSSFLVHRCTILMDQTEIDL